MGMEESGVSRYKPCVECGANLDPEERCDCTKKEPASYHKLKAVREKANQYNQRYYTTADQQAQYLERCRRDWDAS